MKRSLNSDGQQFHQYQQNIQSPLILTHWIPNKNNNKNKTNEVRNPGLGLGNVQK